MRKRELSRAEWSALNAIQQAQRHFDGLGTSRSFRAETARRLVNMGLIESGGMAVVCDGDTFAIQPERYREIFKLTDGGIRMLRKATP